MPTEKEFQHLKTLGSRANELLGDEVFLDILKSLKEDAIFGWANAKTPVERETFWHELQAAVALKTKLETIGQNYRAEVANIAAQDRKTEMYRKTEMHWRVADG